MISVWYAGQIHFILRHDDPTVLRHRKRISFEPDRARPRRRLPHKYSFAMNRKAHSPSEKRDIPYKETQHPVCVRKEYIRITINALTRVRDDEDPSAKVLEKACQKALDEG